LLVIAVGMAAVAIWTALRPTGNIDAESRDFSVKDTASISKVFLSDRSGNNIVLTRTAGNVWMINDSMKSNHETAQRLLKVIHDVTVKSRVAKAAYNNVVGDLAASSTKVEIYLEGNESPEKTYYVGGHTQDALGTFMIMEGSDLPFVTEMPGFNGYLTPWYPTRVDDWRSNTVFEYDVEQIKRIEIDYPMFPDRTFALSVEDSLVAISHLKTTTDIRQVSRIKLENYLIHYRRLPYLQEARMLGKKERDSMATSLPMASIRLMLVNGSSRTVQLYPMPISDRSLVKEDDKGRPLEFDLDHMYCKLDGWPFWVVVQHYAFDPVLQKYEELLKAATSTD
ncbi:MAG: DUF4340 domain-containing protein, partial [Bacteroidota bacterium]